MAEPLVLQFGPEIPRKIAGMLAGVVPGFKVDAFMVDALRGYDALDLMARGTHLAQVMRRHLPADAGEALAWVRQAIDQPVDIGTGSLAKFVYLPYTCYVAALGLQQFEAAMDTQHRLTQLFTAEFSIRPFLVQHPQATLDRLNLWVHDPSEHVRRLVSEGTRPRLPWGSRLRAFQQDPAPVLALLEKLKDDPSLYVRRSVANNLNDIGKDHPALLVQTVARWLAASAAKVADVPDGGDAPDAADRVETVHAQRLWLATHALRSLVKAGHRGALAVLGHGERADVGLTDVAVMPAAPVIGGSVRVACTVHNPNLVAHRLMLDLRVHYCKAGGTSRPKVFKLKQVELPAGESVALGKTLSLRQMTTRTHHAGHHRVELLVNGDAYPLGSFYLQP